DPDQKVVVSAKCNKSAAEYTVSVRLSGGVKKKEFKNSVTKSFGAWIDEDGELVPQPLAVDISSLLIDKKSQ
ncbi:hypothetical protein HK100_012072, partial [Physocladia obscura]